MNASLWRLLQSHGHVQGSDRQVPLHAITDCPADDAGGIEIANNGQIQPAFTGLDVGYVTSPFLVWAICREILIQQVGRDVERIVAVCRGLVFLGSDYLDSVPTHQTAHAPPLGRLLCNRLSGNGCPTLTPSSCNSSIMRGHP